MTMRQWNVVARGIERKNILKEGAGAMQIKADQTPDPGALMKVKAAYSDEVEKLKKYNIEAYQPPE